MNTSIAHRDASAAACPAIVSTVASSIGLLVVVLMVGLAGCDRPPQNAEEASAIVQTVETIEVELSDNAYRSTTFFGTLKSRRNIPLAFTQGGRIATINVSTGQSVVAGQVLAQTDAEDLNTQKTALQNSIDRVGQSANTNLNSVELKNQTVELQRQLDTVNRAIADTEIRAPFDGVVALRNIDVGQVVSAGMPVFDLVDSGVPVIESQVATGIANQMKQGENVWVLVATRPYQATITAVNPTTASSSRTRKVTLTLAQGQPVADLNPGDAVELRYWTQTNRSGFWLPYAALQRQSSGLWSALVVESKQSNSIVSSVASSISTVGVRTLEVIALQDDLALVDGALKQGDRIIINGLNRIVPGQQVYLEPVQNDIVPPGPVVADTDQDDPQNTASSNGQGTPDAVLPSEPSP